MADVSWDHRGRAQVSRRALQASGAVDRCVPGDAIRQERMRRSGRSTGSALGVIGFSAGGHLAASVSNMSVRGDDDIDKLDSRPNLAILCYPVISFFESFGHIGSRDNLLDNNPPAAIVAELSMETRVTEKTPPTFLFHTGDDPVVNVENSIAYADALHKAKVPFALHVYPHGRHGVGLAGDDPVLKTWPTLCAIGCARTSLPRRRSERRANSFF